MIYIKACQKQNNEGFNIFLLLWDYCTFSSHSRIRCNNLLRKRQFAIITMLNQEFFYNGRLQNLISTELRNCSNQRHPFGISKETGFSSFRPLGYGFSHKHCESIATDDGCRRTLSLKSMAMFRLSIQTHTDVRILCRGVL